MLDNWRSKDRCILFISLLVVVVVLVVIIVTIVLVVVLVPGKKSANQQPAPKTLATVTTKKAPFIPTTEKPTLPNVATDSTSTDSSAITLLTSPTEDLITSSAVPPTPINCVIIGDYQTNIDSDPTSIQEGDLVWNVVKNLFNDPTVDFHASLNYFGWSTASNDEDSVEFTTMLSLSDLNAQIGSTRDTAFPFPSPMSNFVDWLNDLDTFDAENRCLLFFSAVTDVTGITLTKTGLYDSMIAVGLNENTIMPFAPTYPTLSIPWTTTEQNVQDIVDLVKKKFIQ